MISCNCNPELDPMHRDTNSETWTKFFIDLRDGEYGITQEMDDNATPGAEWNGIIQAQELNTRPNEGEAKAYLENGAVELIKRVLAGGTVEWDGNNMAGSLDDDARAAFDELVQDLENTNENPWSLQTCSDWYGNNSVSELGLTVETTDEEIEKLAEEYEADAKGDSVILADDLADYLKIRRDELKEDF